MEDERLHMLSIYLSYVWVIDSSNALALVKGGPGYTKFSQTVFFDIAIHTSSQSLMCVFKNGNLHPQPSLGKF